MKKILMLAMVVGLLVSGCSQKVWVIPQDKSIYDFERDKAECRYEARIYTPPSNAYVPPAPRDRYGISGAIATGLAKGIEEGLRQAELFGLCMRARGYYLTDKLHPEIQPVVTEVPPIPAPQVQPQTTYTPTPQYPPPLEPEIVRWHSSLSSEKQNELADEYLIAKKENGNLTWAEFLKGKFKGRPGGGSGYHWEKDEKGNPVYVPHDGSDQRYTPGGGSGYHWEKDEKGNPVYVPHK